MADFHDEQVVPFEIDHILLEFFGDHQAIRNLAWKQRVPNNCHNNSRFLKSCADGHAEDLLPASESRLLVRMLHFRAG